MSPKLDFIFLFLIIYYKIKFIYLLKRFTFLTIFKRMNNTDTYTREFRATDFLVWGYFFMLERLIDIFTY